jgi:hypothetical protein
MFYFNFFDLIPELRFLVGIEACELFKEARDTFLRAELTDIVTVYIHLL